MRQIWPMMLALAPILAAIPCPSRAAETAPALLLQAEGQSLAKPCNGAGIRIEGNHNAIVLAGPCGDIQVNGVANQVTAALTTGATVRIEGSGNRVIYQAQAAPRVLAFGPGNTVIADAPPPPAIAIVAPAAGPLELAGDDQHRLADCTGRSVAVHGTRSAYVLRGGCQSVTVTGALDTIQAELAPGARIAIDGDGITVAWAIKPGIPNSAKTNPTERVRGHNSRVMRTDRLGGQPIL